MDGGQKSRKEHCMVFEKLGRWLIYEMP